MSRSFIIFETAPGIEDIVTDEIRQLLQRQSPIKRVRPGELQLTEAIQHRVFHSLRTVYAVYLGLHFDIPRPKALLGHQNFTQLISAVTDVIGSGSAGNFSTVMLNAAGSESRIMQRILHDVASELGLSAADEGDLLLRIRKTPDSSGWDVLIRTTPRPLSTRDYRQIDYEGALNSAVARAVWHMIPSSEQSGVTIVNVASGSGTILIESDIAPASIRIGFDNSLDAIHAAQTNTSAAARNDINWCLADARFLPLDNASVDMLVADLPFGNLVSDHAMNQEFYPRMLAEAARIARPNAPFLILTHEIKLMEQTLTKSVYWAKKSERRINLRGLHPRFYLLSRCE